MGRTRPELKLALGLAAALAAHPALAGDHDEVLRLKQAGDILPLETILARTRAHVPGELRILEAELEHDHGRYVYELEVVNERGEVWELELDARSGELTGDGVERER